MMCLRLYGKGHERGVDTLRAIVRCCGVWGVPNVTVYAFSQVKKK